MDTVACHVYLPQRLHVAFALQLLDDPEAKVDSKRKRKDVLRQFSFAETFGAKSGQRQKRPRVSAEALEDLVSLAQVWLAQTPTPSGPMPTAASEDNSRDALLCNLLQILCVHPCAL